MPRQLSDFYRTAFVTGASTGLGQAFAEMLLRDGVRVWGTARDAQRLGELSRRYSPAFTPVVLELNDGPAAEAAFVAAAAAAGGFDVVINNAGFGAFGDFAATEFAVWEEQVRVMLLNTARLAHVAIRQMRGRADRASALVNISSLAAEFPLPYQAAYNMCKSGLTALSESLMIEMAGSQTIVLDVRPGDYRTDFETSLRRPPQRVETSPRMARAWAAFGRMMKSGPQPAHAAASVRRALLRRRSATVRTGRLFQAAIGPFIARFGSLDLQRRVQAYYFDV